MPRELGDFIATSCGHLRIGAKKRPNWQQRRRKEVTPGREREGKRFKRGRTKEKDKKDNLKLGLLTLLEPEALSKTTDSWREFRVLPADL